MPKTVLLPKLLLTMVLLLLSILMVLLLMFPTIAVPGQRQRLLLQRQNCIFVCFAGQ